MNWRLYSKMEFMNIDENGYPYRDYIDLSIWDKKDNMERKEDNMEIKNEVLKVYVERKKREIDRDYKTLIDEEYNKLPEVQRYNELVKEFETSMEELVDEFNREDYKPFQKSGYAYNYMYEMHHDFYDKIAEKYIEKMNAELQDLKELVKEINAQLSMSCDKDYQVEVLTRYGILDKKGKITIE